jgi:hypothetical protein
MAESPERFEAKCDWCERVTTNVGHPVVMHELVLRESTHLGWHTRATICSRCAADFEVFVRVQRLKRV